MKIYNDSPEVRAIVAMAFPHYAGRKFAVNIASADMNLASYWSGGSRDYFALVDISTGRTIPIPENGTPYTYGGQTFTLGNLPLNIALVCHSYLCGKDAGCTVYVAADNLNRYALPAPAELTLAQKIVLAYTRSRKSSYAGKNRAQMALEDSGLPLSDWESAKSQCIANGWLNKVGAITDTGKNLIGMTDPYSLRVSGFNRFGIAA